MVDPWTMRLREFLPGWLAKHEYLAPYADRLTAILHGSTTWGVDDAHSDIDLWGILPDGDCAALSSRAGTSFFGFEIDGKAAHLNAESETQFRSAVRACDMDRIYQLRRAVPVVDGMGCADELTAWALRPMRPEVASSLFFFHYVELRSEHRACDNPLERRQPVALLLALAKTLAHALRAAIVLDRQPYPYDKWLLDAARETETGRLVADLVDRTLHAVESGALRSGGPERENAVGREVRAIRQVLIDAARAKGIDEPWLREWWLYMDQARDAVTHLEW